MKKYNITFKDFILRTWLDIKMNLRYLFNIKKIGKFNIPQNYVEVFSDDFKSGEYKDKWDNNIFWPNPFSPDNLNLWLDPEQIKITDNGVELYSVIKPKYFDDIQKEIPNAVGLIRTKESWKYGIFKFVCKLPKGTYLWPALWLSGRWNWPPEIDLLEGKCDDTINYYNNTNLQSNVHFGSKNDGTYKHIGGRKHRLPNETTEEYIEYIIWWEKDFIKFYYNGYLVRHITDKKVLDGMFEDQRVIVGNGLYPEFNKDNLTPMILKKIEIFKLKYKIQ
jgi:beta-glucanase (GH16 family)